MKKLILFLILVFSMIYAETKLTMTICNVRESYSAKSEKITIIDAGEEVEVLGVYGDYKKVEVIAGSDHVGKIGYMWIKLIDEKGGKYYVGGEGTSLREKPTKNSKRIANVAPKAELKILDTEVTWYKVKYKDIIGWVYKSSLK